jgi:hypothetical protein
MRRVLNGTENATSSGGTGWMPECLNLVVEDEPSVSLVFTELLEAAGFAVAVCTAYPEAAIPSGGEAARRPGH